MFFQQNSRMFFWITRSIVDFLKRLPMVPRCSWCTMLRGWYSTFQPRFQASIAEVCVFEIEGCQKLVETAQLEKLAAIERAGAAAAVEARVEVVDGRVLAMPHAQRSGLPPALREACLLTASCPDR